MPNVSSKTKPNKKSTSTFRSYRNTSKKKTKCEMMPFENTYKYMCVLMKYICVSLMHTFAYIWQMKTLSSTHTQAHAIRYYYFIINQSKTKWSFDRLWKVMLIQKKNWNEIEWNEMKREKTRNAHHFSIWSVCICAFALEKNGKSNVYTWNLFENVCSKYTLIYTCHHSNARKIYLFANAPNMCNLDRGASAFACMCM